MSNINLIRVRSIMKTEFDRMDGIITVAEALNQMQHPEVRSLIINKRHSDDEFGRIHNKTLIKYQALANGILNNKVVRDTPKELSLATGLDKMDISNLKKKNDFAMRIIQCNDEIELIEYTGTDTNYKNSTKQFFIVKGFNLTEKQLGFNEITSHSVLPTSI